MENAFFRHQAEDSVAFSIRASNSTDQENIHLKQQLARQSKFLDTGVRDSNGKSIRIRYCVLGAGKAGSAQVVDNRPRVLMVMGLAASLDAWKPQIHDIMSIPAGGTEPPVVMCLLDNRGVGLTSSPAQRKDYSTTLMARDAALVMDEIGWNKAHVVGFSMGGMIACKMASLWPQRIASLTLISSTRGGWDTLPRSMRAWRYVLKLVRDNNPKTKATLDLKFHFTKKSLQKRLPGWGRRKDALLQEYLQAQAPHDGSGSVTSSAPPSVGPSAPQSPVVASTTIPSTAMGSTSTLPTRSNLSMPSAPNDLASLNLSAHEGLHLMSTEPDSNSGISVSVPEQSSDAGLRGQMHACWTHKMSRREEEAIKDAKLPVMCIHGRHDIVAEPKFGERLAAQLEATLVMLEGAHFIPRECGHQVSLLIENLVLGQSRALERAHLDPDRHMQAEVISSQPILPYSGIPDYAGEASERSAPAGLRMTAGAKTGSTQLGTLSA